MNLAARLLLLLKVFFAGDRLTLLTRRWSLFARVPCCIAGGVASHVSRKQEGFSLHEQFIFLLSCDIHVNLFAFFHGGCLVSLLPICALLGDYWCVFCGWSLVVSGVVVVSVWCMCSLGVVCHRSDANALGVELAVRTLHAFRLRRVMLSIFGGGADVDWHRIRLCRSVLPPRSALQQPDGSSSATYVSRY